jgi:hypothetical protein
VNYLIDPFEGELVEFSKAGPTWLTASEKAGKAKEAVKAGGRDIADMIRAHPKAAYAQAATSGIVGGTVATNARARRRARKAAAGVTKVDILPTKTRKVSAIVRTGRSHPAAEPGIERFGGSRHTGPERGIERYGGGRHKGPERGIEHYGVRKQYEGAPGVGVRGTPFSDLAHQSRTGRRLGFSKAGPSDPNRFANARPRHGVSIGHGLKTTSWMNPEITQSLESSTRQAGLGLIKPKSNTKIPLRQLKRFGRW